MPNGIRYLAFGGGVKLGRRWRAGRSIPRGRRDHAQDRWAVEVHAVVWIDLRNQGGSQVHGYRD